jgi:hypothetical protein
VSEAIKPDRAAAVVRRREGTCFRPRATTKKAAIKRDPRGANAASGAITHGANAVSEAIKPDRAPPW